MKLKQAGSTATKLFATFVALVAWFGFVLPYLVSSDSSLLVVLGFLVTGFCTSVFLVVLIQEILDYQRKRNQL